MRDGTLALDLRGLRFPTLGPSPHSLNADFVNELGSLRSLAADPPTSEVGSLLSIQTAGASLQLHTLGYA